MNHYRSCKPEVLRFPCLLILLALIFFAPVAVSFALQPVSWAPICPKPLQPLGAYLSHWSSSNALTTLAAVGFPRFPAWQQSQCRLPSVPARLWDLWVSRMQISSVDDCLVLGSPPFSKLPWLRPGQLGSCAQASCAMSSQDPHGRVLPQNFIITSPCQILKYRETSMLHGRVTVFQLGIHNPWVLWKICPSHFSAASFTTSWKSFATPLDASPLQIERRISAETASSCISVQVTTKKNKKDRESTPHRSQSQSSAHFGSSFSIRVHMAMSLVR